MKYKWRGIDEITDDMRMYRTMFDNKTILITGGTGTLGTAIVQRLLNEQCKEIRVYSRGENKQVKMMTKYPSVKYYLGAVEEEVSLEKAIVGADIIFHLAAMKHMDLAEKQPYQTVLTNIYGSVNVIKLAIRHNVQRVVGISTDKAVNPNNLYGMTKKIMEYLFLWANTQGQDRPEFFTVRYGNVFGSAGSVVEKWYYASKRGEKIKITNPDMTRFFFGVDDAVNLIFAALEDGDCNSVYTLEMKALKIGMLAELMQSSGLEIIGNRDGEKTCECLISDKEMLRTQKVERNGAKLFKITKYIDKSCAKSAYTSDNVPKMDEREIKTMLNNYIERLKNV